MLRSSSKSRANDLSPAEAARPRRSWPKRIGIALLYIIWVVGVFFLTQVLIGFLMVGMSWLGISFAGVNEALFNTIIAGVIYVVTLTLAVIMPLVVLRRRTTAKELGVQRSVEWRDLLLPILAFIAYGLLSWLLITAATMLFSGFDLTQKQDIPFQGLSARYEYLLAFITLVIVAPIAEELLFRGYLFSKIRRHVPTWLTILLVSATFGAVHGQWNVAIDTFALSVVMCGLRVYTGTIWAGVVVHMIKNGIAFYFLFVSPLPVAMAALLGA